MSTSHRQARYMLLLPTALGRQHTEHRLTITLMVGTNNIEHDDPRRISREINECATLVKRLGPHSHIAICGLEYRLDKPHLNPKVYEVNQALQYMCNNEGLSYVPSYMEQFPDSHPSDVLGRKGLHLSTWGKVQLQRRINYTNHKQTNFPYSNTGQPPPEQTYRKV